MEISQKIVAFSENMNFINWNLCETKSHLEKILGEIFGFAWRNCWKNRKTSGKTLDWTKWGLNTAISVVAIRAQDWQFLVPWMMWLELQPHLSLTSRSVCSYPYPMGSNQFYMSILIFLLLFFTQDFSFHIKVLFTHCYTW